MKAKTARQRIQRILLLTALAVVSPRVPSATAAELGVSHASSPQSAPSSNESQSPKVSDPNHSSRIAVTGTLDAHNTGIESVLLANAVAQDASRIDRVQRAKRNTVLTTRYVDHNVDVSGCTLLRKNVTASCYGLNDGFKGGPTLIGRFDPTLITAAFPDTKQQGNILVVRMPTTNVAHAVTITDWGPAKRLQKPPSNRAIDLSYGAIAHFGVSCPALLKNVEIYQCPNVN